MHGRVAVLRTARGSASANRMRMLCCMHRAGVLKGELNTCFCVREISTPQMNMRFKRRMNCEMQLAGNRESLYPVMSACLIQVFYHPVTLRSIAPAMLLSLCQSAARALRVQSWSRRASREATTDIVPLMIWIGPSKDSVCRHGQR